MDCDVTYCTHVSAHPWSIVHNLRTVTIIHQHHWQILFPSPLSYGWTVEFVCTSARAICIIDLAWQCRWKSDTNSTVQVFKFVFAPLFLACLSRYVCVEQYALWVASTWFSSMQTAINYYYQILSALKSSSGACGLIHPVTSARRVQNHHKDFDIPLRHRSLRKLLLHFHIFMKRFSCSLWRT